MAREILFRGFYEGENGSTTIYVEGRAVKGKWIYGYYWLNAIQRAYITTADGDMYVVIPSTVGQYTGLDDKNGKKIFEGDIGKYDSQIGSVSFDEYWKIDWKCKHIKATWRNDLQYFDKIFEVTGTIFDNEVI